MDDWMVAFWDTNDHWQRTPTRVYQPKGCTAKEVQDRIAPYAQANPHLIYFVVRKEDYYASIRATAWSRST